MRIARVDIHPVRLDLERPLVTSRVTVAAREGALLALEADDGRRGWGEALPLPAFGTEGVAEAIAALEKLGGEVCGRDARDLDRHLDAAEAAAAHAPSARAALDGALHDLLGRVHGCPVARLLARGNEPLDRVPTGVLVRGDDPEECAREARRAVAAGFRSLKLKVGAGDPQRDLARVDAVRSAVGRDVALRADANGAWDEALAVSRLAELARFELAFVEQPVAASDLGALARVRAASPIAVAADEAVRDEATAAAILRERAADLLVLKPAALGGLRTAARVAARAREAGVDTVVTSFLDSAIGTATAAHLAASLGTSRHAAGLGERALTRSPARWPELARGVIAVPGGDGIGLAPTPLGLEAALAGPTRSLEA